MSNIKAILFDLDGTLLDTEQLYFAGFVAEAKTWGVADPEGLGRSMIGVHSSRCAEIVAQTLGDKANGARFVQGWHDRFTEASADGVPLKPGAEAATRDLHGTVPLAVVTSSRSSNAVEALQKAGLWGRFEFLIGGDQVTRRKPDPEPYRTAIDRLGLAPSSVLALEDSAVGVRSALGAGAQVIQVPDIVQPTAETRALGHMISPDIATGLGAFGFKICAGSD